MRSRRGIGAVIIILPLLITIVMQNMQLEQLLEGIGYTAWDSIDSELEETVIGIVAKEMDAGFAEEALRAQCVLARTNYLDAKEKGASEPEAMSVEEMQLVFGDNFSAVYEKIKACASDTAGEVLTWQDAYVYAPYHAVSNGVTRNMQELYADVHMPYLVSTECHDDTTAEGYLSVCYWNREEFLEKIKEAFPEADVQGIEEITITARDTSEYVLSMQIGQTTCGGEEFRSALALNSACFTIADTGENIRIVTKGIGHGFGMSQHMAGVLAEEGKNYKEILAYFFPETELKCINHSYSETLTVKTSL